MRERIAVFANETKDSAARLADRFREIADSAGFELSETPEGARLAVSIGGDGTVLRAARKVYASGVPLAHINTGTLGFIGEEVDDLDAYARKLFLGDFETEERLLLKAQCGGREIIALNDIVVKNGATARVINLELSINSRRASEIKGDGIIVATPTGSTAYSLAAGGPVAEPTAPVYLVTPLNPHSLASRSVILGIESVIEISLPRAEQEVILTADGQVAFPVDAPGEITVTVEDKRLKLIRSGRGFFGILSRKMNWGV